MAYERQGILNLNQTDTTQCRHDISEKGDAVRKLTVWSLRVSILSFFSGGPSGVIGNVRLTKHGMSGLLPYDADAEIADSQVELVLAHAQRRGVIRNYRVQKLISSKAQAYDPESPRRNLHWLAYESDNDTIRRQLQTAFKAHPEFRVVTTLSGDLYVLDHAMSVVARVMPQYLILQLHDIVNQVIPWWKQFCFEVTYAAATSKSPLLQGLPGPQVNVIAVLLLMFGHIHRAIPPLLDGPLRDAAQAASSDKPRLVNVIAGVPFVCNVTFLAMYAEAHTLLDSNLAPAAFHNFLETFHTKLDTDFEEALPWTLLTLEALIDHHRLQQCHNEPSYRQWVRRLWRQHVALLLDVLPFPEVKKEICDSSK